MNWSQAIMASFIWMRPASPSHRPWAQRWCPVSHYNGEEVTHGWVKARYVRDSDCP